MSEFWFNSVESSVSMMGKRRGVSTFFHSLSDHKMFRLAVGYSGAKIVDSTFES